MAGTFEITLTESGRYRFNNLVGSGQVIKASQGYSDKKTAKNGIDSVRRNSEDDARFERKVSGSDRRIFRLRPPMGEIVGTNQMYKYESVRDNGIQSVKTKVSVAAI